MLGAVAFSAAKARADWIEEGEYDGDCPLSNAKINTAKGTDTDHANAAHDNSLTIKNMFSKLTAAHSHCVESHGNHMEHSEHSSDCCFTAGTIISAPGKNIKIEKVKIGQKVYSYNFLKNKKERDVVKAVESPVRKGFCSVNNGQLEATDEHPIRTRKKDGKICWAAFNPAKAKKSCPGLKNIKKLQKGDSILHNTKGWVRVKSLRYVKGKVRTYNLDRIEKNNNFFANGFLVHNKCCFPAGTMILAKGKNVRIEKIKAGQKVYSYNFSSDKKEKDVVKEIESPIREGLYSVNKGQLKVTDDHPIRTRKKDGKTCWAAFNPAKAKKSYKIGKINKLQKGDSILHNTKGWVKIKNLQYIKGKVQTYNLKKIEKNKNFFANGFLVHNKGY